MFWPRKIKRINYCSVYFYARKSKGAVLEQRGRGSFSSAFSHFQGIVDLVSDHDQKKLRVLLWYLPKNA